MTYYTCPHISQLNIIFTNELYGYLNIDTLRFCHMEIQHFRQVKYYTIFFIFIKSKIELYTPLNLNIYFLALSSLS